jgi:hypothetical protein
MNCFLVFNLLRTIKLFGMFLNRFHIEKHAYRTIFYFKIDNGRILMMEFDSLHVLAR